MGLRILMIGDENSYLRVDGEMLRQRGFRVYLCERNQIVDDMVNEVKPDIVFINSRKPGKQATDLYHQLIDNITYASLPVIYTLSEDDVYLVNRKRTTMKERRYIISDNVLDAIKMAMVPTVPQGKRRVRIDASQFTNIYTAFRA